MTNGIRLPLETAIADNASPVARPLCEHAITPSAFTNEPDGHYPASCDHPSLATQSFQLFLHRLNHLHHLEELLVARPHLNEQLGRLRVASPRFLDDPLCQIRMRPRVPWTR